MKHSEADLIEATRSRLEWTGPAVWELVPILKGGSDRNYFRVLTGERSVILMEYGAEREENQYYASIGHFLAELGVRVPGILAHDPAARLIWVEDIGPVDLHAFRERPWEERRSYYRDALAQVAVLHQRGFERARHSGVPLMPGFDEALYAWERDYFYREFVGGLCGIHLTEADRAALEAELRPGADRLVADTPALVHRDFQSQNVMIREEKAYLIDFQGMRVGSHAYDLASLLLDPYVSLSSAERSELLADYAGLRGDRSRGEATQVLFRAAGIQRLMQALGAYGFLGLKKGRKAFLAHVDPALERLAGLAAEDAGLGVLPSLLQRCREAHG
jgi:aminoglycoside/choline kinase family phosphotransferase